MIVLYAIFIYYVVSRALLSAWTYTHVEGKDRPIVLWLGLFPFTGEDIMWQSFDAWKEKRFR